MEFGCAKSINRVQEMSERAGFNLLTLIFRT